MRVCIINRLMGIRRGGGEYFDLNAAQALARRGHEVHIVTGCKISGIPKPVSGFGVTYVATPYLADIHYRLNRNGAGRIARRLAGYAWHYDGQLFEHKAFTLIGREAIPDADIYQLCGRYRLAARLSQELAKVAACWWPGPPTLDDETKRKVHLYAGNFARGNTMPTLLQIAPQARNIPPGVDLGLFRPRARQSVREALHVDQASTVILFVGRLIPIKNLQLLIDAFAKAVSANRRLQLVLIGEGTERGALEQSALSHGIKDSVVFLGQVEGKSLAKWYSASDIFVIPSLYESFSIVALEAMASGLPVIASDVGHLPTLVKPGGNGLLFPSGNRDALSTAILELAGDLFLARAMGDEGRKFVEANFGWERIGETIEQYYESLVRNNQVDSFAP